ncbi:MAG: hypothetical protein II965_08735, partial [Pyramidobacter sp.]|nr:hypothetical protein [Pyramidobacter sp.]
HFAGKITRSRIKTWGTQITVTEALKADNPISVSIRESAKPGFITIKAEAADVLLTDALRSNVSTGEVSITAKNIIATDNALINSNTVDLKATATIGDEWRGDPVKLIPIDDTVNVKAEAGQAAQTGEDGIEGLINLAVVGGAASVDLKAVDGSATLKADGTITGRAEGADIELNSAAGSIGSADVPFAIVGEGDTRLSAFAIDTVNIAKDKGDLKVVWVDTHGDVTLETKDGSIVDAYPVERERNLSDNELVEIWKSAGIISTDADGSSMTAALRDESIANVETLIRSDYAAYLSAVQTLKSVNEQLESGELSEEWKATLTTRKIFLEKQLAYLSRYENVTDIEAYIAEQKKTEGTELYDLVQINAEALGGFTKDYLLYAVQDAVLNPSPGTVKSNVEPFIFGKTITLKSYKDIGSFENSIDIIQAGGDALLENDMAGLKKLSQVNPADVVWDEEKLQFIVHPTHEIGLEAEEDVTAKAGTVILIASPRKDLAINSVESEFSMIRLYAGGDVFVSDNSPSLATGGAAVKGPTLFIAAAGGNTDIGSQDRPLTVELTVRQDDGSIEGLRANTGRSAYIKVVSGDVALGSIAAKQDLFVTTSEDGKGIYMSEGQGRLD